LPWSTWAIIATFRMSFRTEFMYCSVRYRWFVVSC